MILVLTYHRIVEKEGALKSFFDITMDELDRHLHLAKDMWKKNLSPDALLESPEGREGHRNGFLVTFDDGTEDHYTNAAPVLERNGARGIFFVSTNLIGKTGYLTAQQGQEMQAKGHAIESHSHDHKLLTGLPIDELRRQLSESRRGLRDWGLGQWNSIAVPGGYFDDTVIQAAKTEGYQILRTIKWGYNRATAPMRVESLTINRRTAGRWFGPLISPRFEAVKKTFYGAKDLVKDGRLKSLYFGLRDLTRK